MTDFVASELLSPVPWVLAAVQTGLVSSVAVLQIRSTAPCLMWSLLRRMGLRRKDPMFWPRSGFAGMDREQWQDWSSGAAPNAFYRNLFYLLNCGYCLCFHLSWATSLAMLAAGAPAAVLLLAPLVFSLSVALLAAS